MTKTGRNDPCPCGSGKKYKKCCLSNDEQAARAAYAAASAAAAAAAADEAGEGGEGGEGGEAGEAGKARGAAPARPGVLTARNERRLASQVSAPPPVVRRKSV
jgi:hypothetical protein